MLMSPRWVLSIVVGAGLMGLVIASTAANPMMQMPGNSSSSSASTTPVEDCTQDDCRQGDTGEGAPMENTVDDSSESNPLNIDVSKMIDVNQITETWEVRIDRWLNALDLAGSGYGKLVATGGIILLALLVLTLIFYLHKRLFGFLHQWGDSIHLNHKRLRIYRKLLNFIFFLFVTCLAAIALLVIWQGGEAGVLVSDKVSAFFGTVFSFGVVLIIAVAIFELISAGLERYFFQLAQRGSPRINTLVPIARNVLYGTLVVLFGLTVISELGINIAPLLAGAGIVGVAVGFGAQALIKDLINGFIIIVEDLIQVGDVVGLGGKTGLIEKITPRKVQLRDLDGRVYTVPFSEITVVENLTKDFSYYLFNVGIAYRESPDEVIDLLTEISAGMCEDDDYKDLIIEPIEILGVDAFADSAIIIKARIKTLPIKQWQVGREFNRRMKYVFDEHNVAIPFPHQTVYFGEDKEGRAPAARVLMEKLEAQNAEAHPEEQEAQGDNPQEKKIRESKGDNSVQKTSTTPDPGFTDGDD